MGGNSSLPMLPSSQQYYVLVGQNVSAIPYFVPPGHPVLSLNLQKNLIRSLPTDLLRLETLILSENSLTEINKEMEVSLLSYTGLKSLDLARNQLVEFNISIDSLESLNLIQNRLGAMPPLSKKLLNISLDFNVIKVFDKSSTALKQLSLSLNYIDQIDESIIFPNLDNLDVSMNRIAVIPNFSTHFPSLKVVNLSYNLFSKFPSPLSKSLIEIDLSGNCLEEFPEEVSQLENLQIIDISYNKFTEIPTLPKSLKKINAQNNMIQKVADAELPNLSLAIFSNNNLGSLPSLKNHVSPNLFFSHNYIKEISFDMLLRPVEQLNLSDNEITVIPVELFSLPRLRILNLDSNKIKEIPSEIINSHISALKISQNPISALPTLPKSLDSLSAVYCSITDVSNAFTECVKITKLMLSGNNITGLPNLPNLQTLAMSECGLTEFPPVPSRIVSLDLSLNTIKEVPENLSAPYLTNLDLSRNVISKIPDFSRYARLVVLKLAANPIACDLNLLKNECLDSLDLFQTKVRQCNVLPKIREILTQTPLQPPFRQLVCTKSGYSETIGVRPENEDSICIRDDLNFYAVCDGHGGPSTATKAANTLPLIYQGQHEFGGDFVNSAIAYVDNMLREQQVKDGSTIVCAEIKHPEIIAAHLGDARAILVTKTGKAKFLTKDHKPTVRKEFERIMHAGGRVAQKRTNGLLAISRALGDFETVGLSHEPEITHKFIDEEEDKYLVIACDGLFETLTNEEAAEIAAGCATATEAAYKLRNVAAARGSMDNISVVVVPLTK